MSKHFTTMVTGALAETIFIKSERLEEGWSNVYGFGVLYPFVRYGAPWATREGAIKGCAGRALYRIHVRPR